MTPHRGLVERLRPTLWTVTFTYAVFASLWIYFSDALLGQLVRDPEQLLRFSVYKGLAFVAVTASLLAWLLQRVIGRVVARENEDRQRHDVLVAGQRRILESVAQGATLHAALEQIVRFIEEQAPEMLCSILLIDTDGTHVRHGAAPSLPREYREAVDGTPIGPMAGSCGTAAYTRKPVYAEDISTDPRWANYKHLALPHGLRASWSTPIVDAEGRVLGTFAMYYRRPALPSAHHRQLIDVATQMASIAIARSRSEQELAGLRRRLEAVVENLREGLVITDPEASFVQWNPAALRVLGYDDPEQGRAEMREVAQFFEVATPDGQELPPDQWPLARVRRGEVLEGYEIRLRRLADSRVRHLSYSGACVTQENGSRLAFVTLADVSKQRAHAEQLRELNASLEARVEQRTQELRSALLRAESADRLKSAFLATMSHELRTPLNSIIGFTGILLQQLAGPLTAEQQRQLGMVRGSARHLLSLINDVLDLSKIEAGQLEVSAGEFALAPLLERVVATMRPEAERKSLELRLDASEAPAQLYSDPRRVEQVLLNLLSNAIKFTERGTVSLRADLLPDFRREPSASPSAAVRFSVRDSGIGIAERDLETLFLPFRQIDSGLSRRHEGTGLGLSICRRLCELLGGEIRVVSEPGVGSTFTVILPLHLEATA